MCKMSQIYKHILFVTDLEDDSRIVVDRVKQIADASERSKVTVLNVVLDNIIAGGYEIMPLYNYSEEQKVLLSHQEKIKQYVEKHGLSTAESQVVEALSTTNGIIDYATQCEVDLIVVGMHERTGFFESLLGNTASSLIPNAPCDVLSVKIPKKDD